MRNGETSTGGMMHGRRIAAGLAIVAMLAAACGGGGPSTTSAAGATDDAGAGLATFNGGGGGGGGNQASGARVRVFNGYSPITSEPGAIEVYGDSFVGDDSKPVMSVPYGTLSGFFDPGVFDAEGDASLTFLPAGQKGQDKALMTQSETLHAGDVLTIYVGTGDKRDDGTFGVFDQVYFHHPTGNGGADTPPPGSGLLIVTSSGLDGLMTSAANQSWYVSYGNGCESGLGGGDGITVTVSPGQTGATYELPPGHVKVAIYARPSDQAAACTGEPIARAEVDAKAGTIDVLVLYAPKDGQLKAQMIPLEP